MAPSRRFMVAVLLVIVAVALAYMLPKYTGGQGGEPSSGREGLLVVVTFPGLGDDIKPILCPGDSVIELYTGGVDPHNLQLDPDRARIVAGADVVVTGGHTPADLKASEIASGVVVNVLRVPGIKVRSIPGDGDNPHYPIYDLDNYKAFIRYLAEVLEEERPECNYKSRADRILGEASRLDTYKGMLDGVEAIVDLPAAQYPAEWLGAGVKLVLQVSHAEAGSLLNPKTVQEVRDALEEGAVAFITVDDRGTPVSGIGEWLQDQAMQAGAKVVKVKAPYLGGSVIDKIEYIIDQLGAGQDS